MKTPEQILNDIKSLPVDEYATPCTVFADMNEGVSELQNKMKENGVRHLPVFEGDKLVGMITDRDVKNIKDDAYRAHHLMSEDVYEVASGTLLREVVFEMSSQKIGSALVREADTGEYSIFTSVDGLNALNEILQ